MRDCEEIDGALIEQLVLEQATFSRFVRGIN
jgi:hypothetical protein